MTKNSFAKVQYVINGKHGVSQVLVTEGNGLVRQFVKRVQGLAATNVLVQFPDGTAYSWWQGLRWEAVKISM